VMKRPLMVSGRVTEADCWGLLESVTLRLTLNVPPAVGVPVIWPVVAPIERPGGRPVVPDQLNGAVPPVRTTV